MFAQDSIELLKLSGIDFAENETRGIHVHRFAELLMSSGIVLNEDVRPPLPAAQSSDISLCLPHHMDDGLPTTHSLYA